MDEKKIIKKYYVDGKFLKEDHHRLARKALHQARGEGNWSERTAMAANIVVPGFQEQEKEQYSVMGSASKMKAHIQQATDYLVAQDKDASSRQIFDRLHAFESLDELICWVFEIDGDSLYVRYEGTDKKLRAKHSSKPLKYNGFRQSYFSRAKEKK